MMELPDDGESIFQGIKDDRIVDIWNHDPSQIEINEMRKSNRRPSEWLKMLCSDWAIDNKDIVDDVDTKFLQYKSYSKGLLSPQLLCRLSLPSKPDGNRTVSKVYTSTSTNTFDFWGILGIEDEFDKIYIVAQTERFASMYNIFGSTHEDADLLSVNLSGESDTVLASTVDPTLATNGWNLDHHAAAAAAAAAASMTLDDMALHQSQISPRNARTKSSMIHDENDNGDDEYDDDNNDDDDIEGTKNQARKHELRCRSGSRNRRQSLESQDQRHQSHDATTIQRKTEERLEREYTREQRRQQKLQSRLDRERFAQEAKEAALRRAAELVTSHRVPIELTRGAAAAKAIADAVKSTNNGFPASSSEDCFRKKSRSSIVVSTAMDLHRIVSHARNLWVKYNAIAREHNQKVNWITIARELGIHVKVREKYQRMHTRAEQRGFDWVQNGHWKLKDHPEIFLEPTLMEQASKMPPPPPDPATTVLIQNDMDTIGEQAAHVDIEASVYDSAKPCTTLDFQGGEDNATAAAAAVAFTFMADSTAYL